AGHLEIEPRPFDLHEVIDATVTLLAPQAYGKGLQLIHGVASDVPVMRVGDPVRLRQVLTNLMDNAIKFTAEGTVSLWVCQGAEQEPQQLRFSVSDTGIGIAGLGMDSLFTAFSQADASVSRRFGGTGLGLAICKQLVESMGGRIDAGNLPVGSEFWFVLPLEIQAEVEPTAELSPVLRGLPTLLYEPDEQVRRSLYHTLSSMGLAVHMLSSPTIPQAGGGTAALADHRLLVAGLFGGEIERDDLKRLLHDISLQPEMKSLLLVNSPWLQQKYASLASLTLLKSVGYKSLLQELVQLLGAVETVERGGGEMGKTHPLIKPAKRPLKVLVVDDNAINLRLTTVLLREGGVDVLEADSGEKAVIVAQENRLDLILMDIRMPGISGLEATDRIRGFEPEDRRTPIIAVTAHAFAEERKQFLEAGLDDCIIKPLDEQSLWQVVDY
ncbi:MAG: response regulator, partial [Gammaproteobacteria bacterium]|nr:response regulator [Gammaproteobacteria bacterium]